MSDKTLKDCCSFQEGYVNPSQTERDYFDGPIKWLRASDLNDGLVFNTEKTLSQKGFNSAGKSAFLFKKETISISKSGTIGRLGILKDEMCGNRAVINIDVNKSQADLHYIFYLLKYKKNEIVRKAEGSIQKNLYVSALETISLNHTDTETQNQIASVLSSLDSKIALNNRINAELEAMAKTVYDYWFVQFDFPAPSPSGRAGEGSPYKSSGGKMVWCEELKRDIPEGWGVKTLIELSNQIGDGLHGTPQYIENSEYNFINGNNLKDGFIQTDELTNKVTQTEYEKYYIDLNRDSILLSINGTLGNLAIYTNEKVLLGKSSAYINCKENHRAFCYLYLKQDQIQKSFWNIATGSTIKNLSLASLKNLKLVYPGIEIIKSFDKLIKPMDDKRENIFKENQQLSSLRDWLLPMLMNG